jgi:hypothetical protein
MAPILDFVSAADLRQAKREYAALPPEQRKAVQDTADRLGVPLDDAHLPAVLHCWKVWE